jgi:hypothetical protein
LFPESDLDVHEVSVTAGDPNAKVLTPLKFDVGLENVIGAWRPWHGARRGHPDVGTVFLQNLEGWNFS